MPLTDLTLAQQLHITSTDLQERREAFQIEPQDLDILANFQSVVASEMETIAAEVLAHLSKFEDTMRAVGDRNTMTRVEVALKDYVMQIFSGFCDEDYAESRLRIGMLHRRTGIGPKVFLAAANAVSLCLMELARNRGPRLLGEEALPQLERAILKMNQFDVHLAFEGFGIGLQTEVDHAKTRMRDYTQRLEDEVQARTQALQAQSQTDCLTGLLNRKAFLEKLHQEIRVAQKSRTSLCLATIDLNDFKKVNDSRGHLVGDETLSYVGRILRESIRETDFAARQGGDEFALILPNTEIQVAKQICERLNQVFSEAIGNPITLSMGVAQCGPRDYPTSKELIQNADALMYRAKRAIQPEHKLRVVYGNSNLKAI